MASACAEGDKDQSQKDCDVFHRSVLPSPQGLHVVVSLVQTEFGGEVPSVCHKADKEREQDVAGGVACAAGVVGLEVLDTNLNCRHSVARRFRNGSGMPQAPADPHVPEGSARNGWSACHAPKWRVQKKVDGIQCSPKVVKAPKSLFVAPMRIRSISLGLTAHE